MKKYAVSYINFFNNNLITKIVDVDGDWKVAIEAAIPDTAAYLDDDIENAKCQAFDSDWLFDVIVWSNCLVPKINGLPFYTSCEWEPLFLQGRPNAKERFHIANK